MKKNLNEFDTPDVGNVTLDLNKVKEKVPSFSSEKLCEMIVCDRYFGCYKEVAVICMEELGHRRATGNTFDFESHIENLQKDLPKLDFDNLNIRDVLQRAISMSNKK
jgi:hypothetical protein